MNHLTMSDKLFVFSNLVGTMVFNYAGLSSAIMASYAILGLWVALKIVDAINNVGQRLDKIEEDKVALAESLRPDTPQEISNNTYDVPSISRLLSAIKVDNDLTLFDAIVESSNNDDLSLRLVRASETILASLNSIEFNYGNQGSNTRREETERVSQTG